MVLIVVLYMPEPKNLESDNPFALDAVETVETHEQHLTDEDRNRKSRRRVLDGFSERVRGLLAKNEIDQAASFLKDLKLDDEGSAEVIFGGIPQYPRSERGDELLALLIKKIEPNARVKMALLDKRGLRNRMRDIRSSSMDSSADRAATDEKERKLRVSDLIAFADLLQAPQDLLIQSDLAKLAKGYGAEEFLETVKQLNLDVEHILQRPDLQESALKGVESALVSSDGYFDFEKLNSFVRSLQLGESIQHTKDIQELAAHRLLFELRGQPPSLEALNEYCRVFNVSLIPETDPRHAEALKATLLKEIEHGEFKKVEAYFEYFKMGKKDLEPELHDAMVVGLCATFHSFQKDATGAFMRFAGFDEAIANDPRVQDALFKQVTGSIYFVGLPEALSDVFQAFPSMKERVFEQALEYYLLKREEYRAEQVQERDEEDAWQRDGKDWDSSSDELFQELILAHGLQLAQGKLVTYGLKLLPTELVSQLRRSVELATAMSTPAFKTILVGMRYRFKLFVEKPWVVRELIEPSLQSLHSGAAEAIDYIYWFIETGKITTEKEAVFLKKILTTKGVQVLEYLEFLRFGLSDFAYAGNDPLWRPEEGREIDDDYGGEEQDEPRVLRPFLGNLQESEKRIVDFLERFPPMRELYEKYQEILENDSFSEIDQRREIKKMEEKVHEYIQKIREGACSDEDAQDPIFIAMLYKIFPPALTLSREGYQRIILQRHDRHSDLPVGFKELNDDLEARRFMLSKGAWVLKPGEAIDLGVWEKAKKKIFPVELESNEPLTEVGIIDLGKELLMAMRMKTMSDQKQAHFLKMLGRLYREANQVTLADVFSRREVQSLWSEFLEDGLRDVIDVSLRSFEKKDQTQYQNLIKEISGRAIGEGKVRQLMNMLKGMAKSGISSERANEEVKKLLSRELGFELEGNLYGELWRYIAEQGLELVPEQEERVVKACEEYLRSMLQKVEQQQAGKVSLQIRDRLVGKEIELMRSELQKYRYEEGASTEETPVYEFEISKRRAHGVAGFNMGVCVVPDQELWAKEGFSNVIIWNKDHIALGGMHFEVFQEGEKIFLSLPGINPSQTIIGDTEPSKLLAKMMAFAHKAAVMINADAVLIPMLPEIHSNRVQMQQVIKAMEYPTIMLKAPHEFSYSPHAYSWQDAYVAWSKE